MTASLRRLLPLLGLGALALGLPAPARADAPAPAPLHRKIHVVDFEGEIDPALAAYLKRRIGEAKEDGADAVVFRIESPGGLVSASSEVAEAILALPPTLRTIAWVPKEAYSGASMAALACDEIVMAPGAKIGDCQPILMGPDGIKPVGEKIETVLRAQFRGFAEQNGWPPLLAEKLVSVDLEVVEVRDADGRPRFVNGPEFDSARPEDLVDGVPKSTLTRVRVVVPKGRLLTMTAGEAKDLGFVRRVFDAEPEFLAAISAPGATVVQVRMSWMEAAGRWLLGAAGILGALVALCAAITVFQGFGLASLIGLAALLLTGLVWVTADLANGFPLFLVGLGILLLAAEAFLVPGFGVPGILGILCVVAGFLFLGGAALPWSGPDALGWGDLGLFLAQFSATVLVAGAAFVLFSRLFPKVPFAGRHLMIPEGALGAGPALPPATSVPKPGASGRADSDLRPSGRALLEGRLVDVTTQGEFVEAGTPVAVVRVEGSKVVVRPLAPAAQGGRP